MTQWSFEFPETHQPDTFGVVAKALNKGASLMLQEILYALAPHNKTGDLLGSWGIIESQGDGEPAVVVSSDPASVYLDEGTKAHGSTSGRKMGPIDVTAIGQMAKVRRVRNDLNPEQIDLELNPNIYVWRVAGIEALGYVAKAQADTYAARAELLTLAIQEATREIFTGEIDPSPFDFTRLGGEKHVVFSSGPRIGQSQRVVRGPRGARFARKGRY